MTPASSRHTSPSSVSTDMGSPEWSGTTTISGCCTGTSPSHQSRYPLDLVQTLSAGDYRQRGRSMYDSIRTACASPANSDFRRRALPAHRRSRRHVWLLDHYVSPRCEHDVNATPFLTDADVGCQRPNVSEVGGLWKLVVFALCLGAVWAAPASGAAAGCGHVSVTVRDPIYWEGSAHHIVAHGIPCALARRLARGCVLGRRSGWRYSTDGPPEFGPRRYWGDRMYLDKHGAHVSFYIAGGGGCDSEGA